MSDLIDRSTLPTVRIEIPANLCDESVRSIIEIVASGFQALIDSAPAVDAVEVVRCKDCHRFIEFDSDNVPVQGANGECLLKKIFSDGHEQYSAVSSDDYCSSGRKRERS